MRTTVEVLPDSEALATKVGERLAEAGRTAVARSGRFLLVLPGGTTPLPLFRWLAGPGLARLPWEWTHLLWGDERCVAPDDPRSNYGAAFAEFLARVPIPPRQVHRWLGEVIPPAAAAAAFEEMLGSLVGSGGRFVAGRPVFDVMILGIGPDGHTASLFPGRPAVEITNRWVAVESEPPRDPKVPRLTLTLPALSASRDVYFLATGVEKREVVRRVLLPSPEPPVPAARVGATDARTFFLDRSSADGMPGIDPRVRTEPGVA
ncbi:MAG: 6-phosphogluconolactonase [Thermoplasmata archaeon]|nr:6-phosphogluconolactonase [Thermoplasmata archaeon]